VTATGAPVATAGPSRRLGLRGARTALVLAVAVVLLVVAVGFWALRVYDPGPRFAAGSIAELQVAVGGWTSVDPEGPARTEVAAFLASLDAARALWPPHLLFE
jgi:hypothetical protein